MAALTEEQDHLLACVIERLRGGGTDPDAAFRMASQLEAWRQSAPPPRSRSFGVVRYDKGLKNAEAKGYTDGLDPAFTEQRCRYRNYDHRQRWLAGFRRARSETKASTNGQ